MKLTNPQDIQRRSRLIYSIYRPDFYMKRIDIANASGYTPEYISRLITGERRVSDEAAKNLAPVLNVREAYLLGEDDYMTHEDFNKVMEKADSLAPTINQIAITNGFCFTGSPLTDLQHLNDNTNEKLISFIENATTSNQRYFIHIDELEYIEVSEDEYKSFCDDISDYIQFKIQQIYKRYPKRDLNL